jgi:hypothetical protein
MKKPRTRKTDRWVVRVTEANIKPASVRGAIAQLVECLRYAGLADLRWHDERGLCYDILPPGHAEGRSKRWAETNAERMRTFGYDAVAWVPKRDE